MGNSNPTVLIVLGLALSAPGPLQGQAKTPTARRAALITPVAIARARVRVEGSPGARQARADALSAAAKWIAKPYPLPEGATGSYHDYFCPDHGVIFHYDIDRPHEHVCPTDGRIWTGPKLDAFWVTTTIQRELEAAVNCGLAYRLAGDGQAGRAGAEVLLACARHYRDRVAGNTPPRWMWQSLDEAEYVIDAVRAVDLLFGSGILSPAEEDLVLGSYLVPTARFLMTERKLIHNIHSWFNAAILTIGAAAGDGDLVRFAIGGTAESAQGLRDQLRLGVSREGFWKEGSLAYHFYTLASLEPQFLVARELGIDLTAELPILRSMFTVPIELADAQWAIPPTNDSTPASIDLYFGHYEIAAGLFPQEQLLGRFLAAIYRESGTERDGIEALLYGPDVLADGVAADRRSRTFPDSGFAILRNPTPAPSTGELYLLLDHGPHGGNHGHPDKLSIALSGLSRALCPDTGTSGYSLPVTDSWYRQTLSHNTVTVDRASQSPATGALLSFRPQGPLQEMVAAAGDAYPFLDWTRGVYLADEGYAIVLDRLQPRAGRSGTVGHVFDWAWHGYGELAAVGLALEPLADRTAFGSKDGYDVPTGLQHATTEKAIEVRWTIRADTPNQPDWKKPGTAGTLRLLVAGEPGTEVFLAAAPGNPSRDSVPLIVVRRSGTGATFRAVLEVLAAGASPRVQAIEPTADGLRVTTDASARKATFTGGAGSGFPPRAPEGLRVTPGN